MKYQKVLLVVLLFLAMSEIKAQDMNIARL